MHLGLDTQGVLNIFGPETHEPRLILRVSPSKPGVLALTRRHAGSLDLAHRMITIDHIGDYHIRVKNADGGEELTYDTLEELLRDLFMGYEYFTPSGHWYDVENLPIAQPFAQVHPMD